MTRRAALLAVLATLAAPAATARAETQTITMPGKAFAPARATMVAGDTVVFRNTDLVPHDVRIAGGLLDSGPIQRFGNWAQAIDQPGAYPFLCTLHAFMSGNLEVVAATLAADPGPVLANEPVALSGRAPAGTPQLALERSTAGGAWVTLGVVAPAPDGTFVTSTSAVEGAGYRVSTPAGASHVVTPQVTARVDLHLDVRSRGGRTVSVHAMPAPAGLTATLEVYSPFRFAWRAVRRARLDAHGGARFRVRAARRALARVTLSRGAGQPALAHSRVVALRTGRSARDPDAIGPSAPHPIEHGGPGPH